MQHEFPRVLRNKTQVRIRSVSYRDTALPNSELTTLLLLGSCYKMSFELTTNQIYLKQSFRSLLGRFRRKQNTKAEKYYLTLRMDSEPNSKIAAAAYRHKSQ